MARDTTTTATMPTTPPPRSMRIHTPPTPMHGAKHDNWEPYSPRRSSRVAEKLQNKHLEQTHRAPTQTQMPTPSKIRNPISQFLSTSRPQHRAPSPPSSPRSPIASSSNNLNLPKVRQDLSSTIATPSKQRSRKLSPFYIPTDNDIASNRQPIASIESVGMLPTPAKTPSKRYVPDEVVKKTSRLLFPPRPATAEEAMPSPRKIRHGTKADNVFTISALAEEEDVDVNGNGAIPIYTDSKERIPSLGGDENPFLSRNSTNAVASSSKRRKTRQKTANELRMEEASRNEEGLIYVFRGRKMLRKYAVDTPVEDDEEDSLSDLEVRRHAGVQDDRPFTRSSYKPRLLFPSQDQLHARAQEVEDEADEEALTDIEVPGPSDRRSNLSKASASLASITSKRHITPPETTEQPSTSTLASPRSTRATRSSVIKFDDVAVAPAMGKVKNNPFAAWGRRKPSSQEIRLSGVKRGGEELSRGEEDSKRTRSGAHEAEASV